MLFSLEEVQRISPNERSKQNTFLNKIAHGDMLMYAVKIAHDDMLIYAVTSLFRDFAI